MIPGASLLPFVPGRRQGDPRARADAAGVRADAEQVAAYARVCGFTLRDHLPPTYPHVLAFPLHMALMADGSFPFGAVGLVHVENQIVQHRPHRPRRGADDRGAGRPSCSRTPRAAPSPCRPRSRVGGQLVWETTSTMLRRGSGPTSAGRPPTPSASTSRPAGRSMRCADDRRRTPSGSSAATSGGATRPSRGTATRSTCTR